jgi:hypothetical protein
MADRPPDSAASGLVALGVAAVVIDCCAGLPLLLALAAGVGTAAVLGIGAGIVAAALLVGAVVRWTPRRRRACEPPPREDVHDSAGDGHGRGQAVMR